MKIILTPGIILFSLLFISCGDKHNPDEKKYMQEVQQYRQEKNDYMRNNPESPFNQDSTINFEPLNYYPVEPSFVFKSKLYVYPDKDTISVYGTKGEERKAIRYGYINFDFNSQPYKVNVYKGTTTQGEAYYSIWFTDRTTGDETYGVGRYIDFDINPDSDYVYTIDFNLAYNPYCAYSARYSCAIPTKEDYIDLAVTAGEKKYQ